MKEKRITDYFISCSCSFTPPFHYNARNHLHFIFFSFFSHSTYRYHEDRMVNYDTQDGYSVTSFQSPLPEQLIKSSISSSSRLNALETLEETSSLELLPSSYTASELVHLPQSHHNVHSNGLLVPSTSILSIREVHFKHAGNYTCSPSNARNGTITIHVLRGKNYNNKLYLRLRTHTHVSFYSIF